MWVTMSWTLENNLDILASMWFRKKQSNIQLFFVSPVVAMPSVSWWRCCLIVMQRRHIFYKWVVTMHSASLCNRGVICVCAHHTWTLTLQMETSRNADGRQKKKKQRCGQTHQRKLVGLCWEDKSVAWRAALSDNTTHSQLFCWVLVN